MLKKLLKNVSDGTNIKTTINSKIYVGGIHTSFSGVVQEVESDDGISDFTDSSSDFVPEKSDSEVYILIFILSIAYMYILTL